MYAQFVELLPSLGIGAQKVVAGVDEVGRGSLASSVVASCVALDLENIPVGLRDSKKLSAKSREDLYEEILATSHVSVASVSSTVIDRINIRNATLKAMTAAVRALPVVADHHFIDGNVVPHELAHNSSYLIKGDDLCCVISAASIVAKVVRDRMMSKLAETFPAYGFDEHAGYGTPSHLDAIKRHGPCPIHRLSFAPFKQASFDF